MMIKLFYILSANVVPIQNPEKPGPGLDDLGIPPWAFYLGIIVIGIILLCVIIKKILPEKSVEKTIYICKKCGNVIKEDDEFCSKCGTMLHNREDNKE